MPDFLEATDGGEERAGGLNQHALVPLPATTELEIGRIALGGMKALVRAPDPLVRSGGDQGQKVLIGGIGRPPGPGHAVAVRSDDPAELHADTPPPVGFPFLAELVGAAALADRGDQLDPLGINDGKQRRLREKGLTPPLVSEQ